MTMRFTQQDRSIHLSSFLIDNELFLMRYFNQCLKCHSLNTLQVCFPVWPQALSSFCLSAMTVICAWCSVWMVGLRLGRYRSERCWWVTLLSGAGSHMAAGLASTAMSVLYSALPSQASVDDRYYLLLSVTMEELRLGVPVQKPFYSGLCTAV